jgi:glycerol-3-phosphate cytidylyltransferase-like family protein
VHEHGGYVIAVVAQDHLIEYLTGTLPSTDLSERFDVLRNHGKVNEIVIADNERSLREIIEDYKPDALVFGKDQELLKAEIEASLEHLEDPMEIHMVETYEQNK